MTAASPPGGIDPALADAVTSIKATHEDEEPRGQQPDAVPAENGEDHG